MELTVLLALTMQHLLAVSLFTSSFLFHSVISAKQDGMLTPDKVTPRGGTQKVKTALVYLANILCAAKSDARAAAVTAQREGQDCLLYTSPSPRDATLSRMPSSA